MEFNKNTQFPVFAKDSKKNDFRMFLAKNFYFSIEEMEDKSYVPFGLYWAGNGVLIDSTQITKEEFISENKDLLEKTGLINLIEKDEDEITTDMVRDDYVRLYVEELKEKIEDLQNEKKQLIQRLEVAKKDDEAQIKEIQRLNLIIDKLIY